MKNIKIAVAYHKEAQFADNAMFVPIHVGAEYSSENLGIQKDSDGDNISKYNPYCCELSATYWLWKNVPDADYYGLCHYRRFFTFEKKPVMSNVILYMVYMASKIACPFILDSRFTISKSIGITISEQDLDMQLEKFSQGLNACIEAVPVDCFCLKKIMMSTYSCKTKLMKAIGLYNYNKLVLIIKEHHPDFYPFFVETMKSNAYHPCNMLIATKKIFNEYASLLFSILGEYHNWISFPDSNHVNNAALRSSGYMGEFITSAFVLLLNHRGNIVKELDVMNVSIASTGLSQSTEGIVTRVKNIILGGGKS